MTSGAGSAGPRHRDRVPRRRERPTRHGSRGAAATISGGDELLAAATVYAESIVRPLQQGSDATVDEFFGAAGISIIPIDRAVARRAAVLRAEHQSLRLPDAMSLATAIMTDSTLLTLDKKLRQIARRVQPSP